MAIIGGGPAGLTAGLYGARGGLRCLLLEEAFVGGQITKTIQVDNYPGFDQGIDGFSLTEKMQRQAVRFGLEVRDASVARVELTGRMKKIHLNAEEIEVPTVILATGASPRKLGLEREDTLIGAGISYCATCDGAFFRGMDVAVIGGGDTALVDALYLTKFVNKVYLIHRRDQLRGATALQNAVFAAPKIEFIPSSVPKSFVGKEKIEGMVIQNLKNGDIRNVDLQGVFVAVGTIPNTSLIKGQVDLDPAGYIVTDQTMRTSLPGVFAAGDARNTALRQVVTAAADGAVAATSAIEYLMR